EGAEKKRDAAIAQAKACNTEVASLQARLQEAAASQKKNMRQQAALEKKLSGQSSDNRVLEGDLRDADRRLEEALAHQVSLRSEAEEQARQCEREMSERAESNSIMARQMEQQGLEIAQLMHHVSTLEGQLQAAQGRQQQDEGRPGAGEVANYDTEFERDLFHGDEEPDGLSLSPLPAASAAEDARARALRDRLEVFVQCPLPADARAKRVDEKGAGHVTCGLCGQEKVMRNLRFDFFDTHLASCRKKSHRRQVPQTSTLSRFLQPRARQAEGAPGDEVVPQPAPAATAPPPPAPPACRGLYPLRILPDFGSTAEGAIRGHLATGRSYEKYTYELTVDAYVHFEKASEECCLASADGIKVLRSRSCSSGGADRDRVLSRAVPEHHAEWMGATWPQCGQCQSECDVFFKKAIHCSPRGCPHWREEPLTDLINECKERLSFFSTAGKIAAALPAGTQRDAAEFLRKISAIALHNSGVLKDEAVFGAMQAWMRRQTLKHGAKGNGIRYTPGAKDFILGSNLACPRSKRFNDAALFKFTTASTRALRQWRAAERQAGDESCLLDCRRTSVIERIRATAPSPPPRGAAAAHVPVVVVPMDEIVALKTLMHNKRHNIVVGGDAVSNAHMVEWSEEVDWRGLGDELASKVKFARANVVSQGAAKDAIRPIKMRPGGGADASAESAFDEATMDEVRAALPGCHVLAGFTDGASQEQTWIRQTLCAYAAREETARHPAQHAATRPYFAGVDLYHLLKALRSAAVYGATVAPWGGRVLAAPVLFSMVGASQEDIRVRDGFSDWRVARLERMVPDLPRAGAPTHWVVGTMMYFGCMSLARVAGASKSAGLSRRGKNTIACFVALLFVLKHGNVAFPHRCATLPLEYFFGVLRTAQTSDQLSVNQMLNLVEKTRDLNALAAKNNWAEWSWSAAGLSRVASTGLPTGGGITDDDFVSIASEAAVVAASVLHAAGWERAALSPFLFCFTSWGSFAATLEQALRRARDPAAEGGALGEDAEPPRKKRRRKAAAASGTDPVLQGSDQAAALQALADDAVLGPIEDRDAGVLVPREESPVSCAQPTEDSVDLLMRRLGALERVESLPNLQGALRDLGEAANAFQPQFKHKGLGNRSTLFKRLQMSCLASVEGLDGADRYVNYDVVCFDARARAWGRVVSTFEKVRNKWVVDLDDADKVQAMKAKALKDRRLLLESVHFSADTASEPHAVWVTSREYRAWTASGGDVCMLPGTHAVVSAVENAEMESWVYSCKNAAALARAELAGVPLTHHRAEHLVHFARSLADMPKNKLLLNETGLGPAVMQLKKSLQGEGANEVAKLVGSWRSAAKDASSTWTGPVPPKGYL
ncbi:unnamed protein product, partial [Prorocentrum cordatum]